MKRLILTTILALVAAAASAQLSVRGGFANVDWHDGDGKGAVYPGAAIAVGYEFALNHAKSLSLRPALAYNFNFKTTHATELIESRATEHGLALPVHLKFALPVGRNARVYLFAGPSLDYGLGYKIKDTFTRNPQMPDDPINMVNLQGWITSDLYKGTVEGKVNHPTLVADRQAVALHLSRLDVALSGGVGAQLRRVFVEAGYDYGLMNHSKKSGTVRREQLNVSVGYNF